MNLEKSANGGQAPKYVGEKSTGGSSNPPDGGWGWVIVFGAGLALSIAMGFNKSVALVYQALLEKFQQSAAATAWVTSLTGMIRMMSSPIVSALCNRFSHRKVAVSAGIITSTSYILSAFPPNLPYLYITLGLMQGIGVNMFIVPSVSIVALYFEKNKGKALAIVTSSFGVGALYMAPVLQVLFGHYGYSGALLILGALVLHFSAAGLLFRPLKSYKTIPSGLENGKSRPHLIGADTGKELNCDTFGGPEKSVKDAGGKLNNDVIFNKARLARGEVDPNLKEGLLELDRKRNDAQDKKDSDVSKGPKGCCYHVAMAIKHGASAVVNEFGLSMLADVQFLLLGFLMSAIAWCMTNSWTMAAGLATEKGFTTGQVTMLLVIIAAAELPLRIASGVIFDTGPVRRLRAVVFAFVAFLVGASTSSIPVVPGVTPTFVVWATSMGLLGACNSQYATVMSDLVPRSKVTSAYGLIRLLQGIGAFLGPVMGGLLRDYTGTYGYGFYAGGLQLMVVSVLFGISSQCRLWCKHKPRQDMSESEV